MPGDKEQHTISIIIPIYNGSSWINNCFDAILKQTAIGILNLEICICDDCSNDDTPRLLLEWKSKFENSGISFRVFRNENATGGVGYSKNRAVDISKGDFLCFQDVDDIMLPDRILDQYNRALREPFNTIIGCQFRREPEGSTSRYTKWANNLSENQLNVQIYTSHGPTVIMPTWFCHRNVFERVGGFCEIKKGCPEDLIFFYKHLDLNGKIARVDKVLLVYTFREGQATFSVAEDTIWDLRVERLERVILSKWPRFTIWNAGKQGRRLYKSLSPATKARVAAFCDVDQKKIRQTYKWFDQRERRVKKEVDIVHFTQANAPFVICVKMDLTAGSFESNLTLLNLKEQEDYVMFS